MGGVLQARRGGAIAVGLYPSELRKSITHPFGALGVAAPLACVPVVAIAAAGNAVGESEGLLRSLQLSQLFTAILAMGVWGQEYESSSLRGALLATPRRLRLLAAKLAVLTTLTLAALAGGVLAGWLSLAMSAGGVALPGAGKAAMIALSWVGMAFVAAGLAVVWRSAVVPGAVLIPLFLGLSQLLSGIVSAARFLPDRSTFAVFTRAGGDALDPGPGMLVLLVWVVCLTAIAAWLFERRDVR